jgi:hypothetical protein
VEPLIPTLPPIGRWDKAEVATLNPVEQQQLNNLDDYWYWLLNYYDDLIWYDHGQVTEAITNFCCLLDLL